MTLNTQEKFGCYTNQNENGKRGKIVRVDTEDALEAFGTEKRGDKEAYVVTAPMRMMKTVLKKVTESKDFLVSAVLVEHPLAFIDANAGGDDAEKEAAEAGFYRGVPESDSKEDAKRVNVGQTPVAFLGVNATRKSRLGGKREREERKGTKIVENKFHG